MGSFSQSDITSCESYEGDSLRGLTGSVSFGRFETEYLAWEKFSSFTRNPYLEEVEQLVKPGYVAQQKAFFEEHYQEGAFMKAAHMPEQHSLAAESSADSNSCISSALDEAINDFVTDRKQGKDVLKLVCPAESSEIVTVESFEELAREIVEAESAIRGKIATKFGKSVATAKVAAKKKNAALPTNKRQMSSSWKVSSQGKAAKLPNSVQRTSVTSLNGSCKKSPRYSVNQRRIIPKPVCNLDPQDINKKCVRMSKENSTIQKNPTMWSAQSVSKCFPSLNRSSGDKRTRSVNRTVSGGTIAGRIMQFLSGNCTKYLKDGNTIKSSVITYPFTFMCEERAAKRKEFFQKLEEKNKAKDKHKTTHVRVNSKIPLTRPRSPKLGRRSSSNLGQESNCLLARKQTVNAKSYNPIARKANGLAEINYKHQETSCPRPGKALMDAESSKTMGTT